MFQNSPKARENCLVILWVFQICLKLRTALQLRISDSETLAGAFILDSIRICRSWNVFGFNFSFWKGLLPPTASSTCLHLITNKVKRRSYRWYFVSWPSCRIMIACYLDLISGIEYHLDHSWDENFQILVRTFSRLLTNVYFWYIILIQKVELVNICNMETCRLLPMLIYRFFAKSFRLVETSVLVN